MLTGQDFDQIKNYFFDVRKELDRSLFWVQYEAFFKKPYLLGAMDPAAAYAQTAAVTAADARKALAANPCFAVSGTNMTTALCTLAAGGGITLTTAGANNDQGIVQPLSITTANSDVCSAFGPPGANGTTAPTASVFNTSNQPQMHALLSINSIAAVKLVMGMKFTNAQDISTDDEAASFKFDTGGSVSTSQFTVATSVAGVDTETLAHDLQGVGVTPIADTVLALSIVVDANRIPRYLVNGRQVGAGPAMTASKALWPVLGIQALTGAAKAMTVRQMIFGARFAA